MIFAKTTLVVAAGLLGTVEAASFQTPGSINTTTLASNSSAQVNVEKLQTQMGAIVAKYEAMNTIYLANMAANQTKRAQPAKRSGSAGNGTTKARRDAAGSTTLTLWRDFYDTAYALIVDIGTPESGYSQQSFLVQFDTGSADLWVYGPGSDTAYTHNIYTIDESSTQTGDGSAESITYGSGNVYYDVYSDTIAVDGFSVPTHPFGVATSVVTGIQESPFDGLIGFAWSSLCHISGGTAWAQAASVTDGLFDPYFTLYLAEGTGSADTEESGGAVCLGCVVDVPDTITVGDSAFFELIYPEYWEIAMDGLTINGQVIANTGTRAILDSGTTTMIVPQDYAETFYAQFDGALQQSNGFWAVPYASLNYVETIGLSFGGVDYTMDLRYLYLGEYAAGYGYLAIQTYAGVSGWTDPYGYEYILVGDIFMKSVLTGHYFEEYDNNGFSSGSMSLAKLTIPGADATLAGVGKFIGDSCTIPASCTEASCAPQSMEDDSYCSPDTLTFGGLGAYCTTYFGNDAGFSSECASAYCANNVCTTATNSDGYIISADGASYWECGSTRSASQADSCPASDSNGVALTGVYSVVDYFYAPNSWSEIYNTNGLFCYYGSDGICNYDEGNNQGNVDTTYGYNTNSYCYTESAISRRSSSGVSKRDTVFANTQYTCPTYVSSSIYLLEEFVFKGSQSGYSTNPINSCYFEVSGSGQQCQYDADSGFLYPAGTSLTSAPSCPVSLCAAAPMELGAAAASCLSALSYSSGQPSLASRKRTGSAYTVGFDTGSASCAIDMFPADSSGVYAKLYEVTDTQQCLIGESTEAPALVSGGIDFTFTAVTEVCTNLPTKRSNQSNYRRQSGSTSDYKVLTSTGQSYTYTAAAPAAASGGSTRKRRAIQAGMESPKDVGKHCDTAKGEVACRVAGRKGLWECLNVMTGLDVCGGCPGEPGSVACSDLDNVLDVQCVMGTCQIDLCEDGFMPASNGTVCVAE